MGRMHSKGKGISASALPYKRTPPSWLKISAQDVEDNICKFAKKGLTPSQIGVILRDSHGIAQVKAVTGNQILRILKAHGLAPEIPEDLYHLIKKAVAIRKHLERNRKDKDSKFRLILVESRIHRLARYYKKTKKLPPVWKYESTTASTLNFIHEIVRCFDEGMKLYISDNRVILTEGFDGIIPVKKDWLVIRPSWNGWRRTSVFFLILLFILLNLFCVLELHRNPVVGGPPKKKNTKFDHLVLGSAAGQGLPNRLQCQGTKALNKTHLPSSSNAGESVAFVTVFTVYNTSLAADSRLSNLFTVGNASYTKTERSMAVLNVFINFIQVTMPRSNIVILTDPASDLSLDRNSVTVYPIQGDYSQEKLMLQGIRSYITFLERKLDELARNPGHISHYIFTDSDIAVVDDLGLMFNNHQNFHLVLTFRNNKEQPLNSGFIAVRGTADAILRAKIFLQEVLKVYSSKFMNASRMLGDQLALAWVVKSHPGFDLRRFTKAQAFLENIGGTSVLFLPCATYNWTPPEGAGQFHGMSLDVVHFKGSRKRLMLESWNFLSSSSDIFDLSCLILLSGRTKTEDECSVASCRDISWLALWVPKISANESLNPSGTSSQCWLQMPLAAWKLGLQSCCGFDFSPFHLTEGYLATI
ncbi:unnamed protein product [Dovyalis caffra]|uniref:Small ribosomal subunit protein uS15 N-terminal domain-containing protein n=1 Tax=Dovyalis caffra TaxID=77055 RepID=A0AAV1S996_9ROSI|nr:unnamed protein product [Dovyalis caffra]